MYIYICPYGTSSATGSGPCISCAAQVHPYPLRGGLVSAVHTTMRDALADQRSVRDAEREKERGGEGGGYPLTFCLPPKPSGQTFES